MPIKARVDVPGAIHHIIAQGIEQVRIFKDYTDRSEFPDRIATAGKGTKPDEGSFCLADI